MECDDNELAMVDDDMSEHTDYSSSSVNRIDQDGRYVNF